MGNPLAQLKSKGKKEYNRKGEKGNFLKNNESLIRCQDKK